MSLRTSDIDTELRGVLLLGLVLAFSRLYFYGEVVLCVGLCEGQQYCSEISGFR